MVKPLENTICTTYKVVLKNDQIKVFDRMFYDSRVPEFYNEKDKKKTRTRIPWTSIQYIDEHYSESEKWT